MARNMKMSIATTSKTAFCWFSRLISRDAIENFPCFVASTNKGSTNFGCYTALSRRQKACSLHAMTDNKESA